MDCTSIMSWNVRGASNDTSRFNVKTVVQESKASFICLQETKMQDWSEKSIKTLGLGSNIGWLEAPPRGLSGGVLTVWNKDAINITEAKISKNWIGTRGFFLGTNSEFACFNVYASQKLLLKKQLWQELSEYIKQLRDVCTVLIGDFNSVLSHLEKENCEFRATDSKIFSSFLTENDLADVLLINPSYTWYGPTCKKSTVN